MSKFPDFNVYAESPTGIVKGKGGGSIPKLTPYPRPANNNGAVNDNGRAKMTKKPLFRQGEHRLGNKGKTT